MEHKNLAFEIKSVDYTGRTLEGFAAAFGNIDGVGDIIHPGAFRKTLSERGGRIKFLWQHDPTEPIGKLQEAREDAGGLFVKAIISDTQRGRDALALLKDNAIGEMSIGYDAVKGGMDYSKDEKGNPVRNLREIKLWEFSLVTFPANEMATVTSVKGQDTAPSEGKPYANVPDDKIEAMDSCVEKVMADGKDKEAAIAICYTSVVEGKALDLAIEEYHLAQKAHPAWVNILIDGGEGGYLIPTSTQEDYDAAMKIAQQVKIGRTISAANYAKLQAARDVINDLCKLYEGMGAESELTDDAKSATIKSMSPGERQADSGQQLNSAAGPVEEPPTTDRLLKLIELELSELT